MLGANSLSVVGKSNGSVLNALLSQNENVFEQGVGKIENFLARIFIKERPKPVFKKSRSVPSSLFPKFKFELYCLEIEDVIESVERSEYATPMVVVP